MNNKKLLLIFVKNPERGYVKTRLAQTVGEEKAYQIYLKLLIHTVKVAEQVDSEKQIWYSSFIDETDGLGGPDFDKKLQKGNDLGERMKNAFKNGFENGFEKILIIGSDCPEIKPQIIEDAFTGLDQNDVVIGPSEDGGYYLLGLRELIPGIFNEISWSTERVFSETINVLKKAEKHVTLLPTLNDIDTAEDLRKSDFK